MPLSTNNGSAGTQHSACPGRMCDLQQATHAVEVVVSSIDVIWLASHHPHGLCLFTLVMLTMAGLVGRRVCSMDDFACASVEMFSQIRLQWLCNGAGVGSLS